VQQNSIIEDSRWEELRFIAITKGAILAIRRTRYLLTAISITGILILVAQFNSLFPWVRDTLTRTVGRKHDLLLEVIYKDLSVVSIPLIGMKISVYDLTLLGALALLVLSTWYWFAARRENHAISGIVFAANERPLQLSRASYLYFAIADYFVFNTMTIYDDPVGDTNKSTRFEAHAFVRIIMFMPVWVPVVTILCDVYSLFVAGKIHIIQGDILWHSLDSFARFEVIIRMIFAFIFATVNLINCLRILKFDKETRGALLDLRSEIYQYIIDKHDVQSKPNKEYKTLSDKIQKLSDSMKRMFKNPGDSDNPDSPDDPVDIDDPDNSGDNGDNGDTNATDGTGNESSDH